MIDQLIANLEGLSARIAELEEEHGGEDGFLGQFESLTKPNVLARSREIRGIKDMNEEARCSERMACAYSTSFRTENRHQG